MSNRGGAGLIRDEPIVRIGGEVGDGDGERLLIGQTVDVACHVGDPRVWGRLSVEGGRPVLLRYEGRRS